MFRNTLNRLYFQVLLYNITTSPVTSLLFHNPNTLSLRILSHNIFLFIPSLLQTQNQPMSSSTNVNEAKKELAKLSKTVLLYYWG